MRSSRLIFALVMVACAAACSGDDDGDGGDGDGTPAIDAPASSIDAPDTPIDAAMACVLPTQTITCTVGNDAPCTAACAGAYCYAFGQVGSVCTQACTAGMTGQCPTGWSCNNMGRCRPPN
jgi:hypothetical protein